MRPCDTSSLGPRWLCCILPHHFCAHSYATCTCDHSHYMISQCGLHYDIGNTTCTTCLCLIPGLTFTDLHVLFRLPALSGVLHRLSSCLFRGALRNYVLLCCLRLQSNSLLGGRGGGRTHHPHAVFETWCKELPVFRRSCPPLSSDRKSPSQGEQ